VVGRAGKPALSERDIENPYRRGLAASDKETKPDNNPPPPDKAPPPQEAEAPPPPPAPPPPADERAPLNRASALNALSQAASSAASCRRDGGPSGTGTASVTFSPEGSVAAVNLAGPFAGTPVGSCIQSLFKNAHVPAFTGSSVTLSKSFRIPE
jgi:hypothetical protein